MPAVKHGVRARDLVPNMREDDFGPSSNGTKKS